MKEIIDKISSYNLFNYLFPGVIFVVILKEISKFDLIQENNFIGAFVYYFIGLVISRFGSLVIGEILQKMKFFIKFAEYSKFVPASEKDEKINLFSEVNNMYRTIISLLVILLLVLGYEKLNDFLEFSDTNNLIILIVLLIILFVFSYKKQTSFILKRVNLKTKNTES